MSRALARPLVHSRTGQGERRDVVGVEPNLAAGDVGRDGDRHRLGRFESVEPRVHELTPGELGSIERRRARRDSRRRGRRQRRRGRRCCGGRGGQRRRGGSRRRRRGRCLRRCGRRCSGRRLRRRGCHCGRRRGWDSRRENLDVVPVPRHHVRVVVVALRRVVVVVLEHDPASVLRDLALQRDVAGSARCHLRVGDRVVRLVLQAVLEPGSLIGTGVECAAGGERHPRVLILEPGHRAVRRVLEPGERPALRVDAGRRPVEAATVRVRVAEVESARTAGFAAPRVDTGRVADRVGGTDKHDLEPLPRRDQRRVGIPAHFGDTGERRLRREPGVVV